MAVREILLGRRLRIALVIGVVIAALGIGPLRAQRGADGMKKYAARYHVIYTDLPKEQVYEAVARITAIAEEYHRRTRKFSGKISKKLPFYLYRRYEDYQKSLDGKMQGSAGVYDGVCLRAAMDVERFSREDIWHVIQHEGWHQFAHMVVSRKVRLPIWLDEGIAEYFGEAIWTGDGIVTGVIDTGKTFRKQDRTYVREGRMQRVQRRIKANQFRPFVRIIRMTHSQWTEEMDIVNYDQVWSMVQFFVHAKDGKYRRKFTAYINDATRGRPSLPAFKRHFGRNLSDLQKEYNEWWLSMEGNPTADLYDRITVETLVSFLGRAKNNKLTFHSAEAFFQAARQGLCDPDIKKGPSQWLPPTLLKKALLEAEKHKNWQLQTAPGSRPMLVLTRDDETVFEGRYILKGRKRLPNVTVKIIPPKVSPEPTTRPTDK